SEQWHHPGDANERCGPEKAASRLQYGGVRLARGAKPADACRAGVRAIRQKLAVSLDRHGTPPSSQLLDHTVPGPLAVSRRRDCVGPAGVSPGLKMIISRCRFAVEQRRRPKGGRRTAASGRLRSISPLNANGSDGCSLCENVRKPRMRRMVFLYCLLPI